MLVKKINLLILLPILILVGCSNNKEVIIDKVTRRKCVEEKDRDKLANFIIKCAEAANPKSDEEGEDLVAQCESTGVNSVCPEVVLCFNKNVQYDTPKPCDLMK